jgi:hypothetical protein
LPSTLVRRTAALFLLAFGVYAATLGLHAFGSSELAGDEPHYLLAAKSIVEDGNVDVGDEFIAKSYAEFYPYLLDRHGQLTKGQLNEPHGVGFPLLIAPAYAIGGATGVQLFLAVLAALAVALAYRLALRVAPDPWALGAAVAVGLSPPFLAYGTAVYPELTAAAALAGAALLALELDASPRRRYAVGCFLLLGSLPWLGTKFVPAGLVIGVVAARTLWRARRRTLAVASVELSLFSVAFYVGINEAIYGGPTPYAADVAGETATDAGFPLGYLDRAYRLVALFLDRDYGLLRWAPVFALAFAGLWLLWRSQRDHLARAVSGVREVELTAMLCATALGAQLLVASFLAPTMFGFWFPPRHLLAALPLAVPLVAWGLRHAPRLGTLLAAITLVTSAWLYVDVRLGDAGFVVGRPDVPFGPLTDAFPLFGNGSAWPNAFAGLVALALALLVLRELRHSRQRAGATRPRYSG